MSVRAEEGLRLQRLGVRLDHSQGKGRRQEGPEGSHQQGKLKRFIRLSTFLLFTSKICRLMQLMQSFTFSIDGTQTWR